MADPLDDIAPATETVAGQKITGVSLHAVAGLMRRFTSLHVLLGGGTIEADKLMADAPDAVIAILAAGLGRGDDKAAEKKLAGLPIGTQAELLDAVIRRSFPGGIGPFRDRLVQLASSLNVTPIAGDGQSDQAASPGRSSS